MGFSLHKMQNRMTKQNKTIFHKVAHPHNKLRTKGFSLQSFPKGIQDPK